LRLVVAAEALQALHLGAQALHLGGVALQLLHLFARGHLETLHALRALHLLHLLLQLLVRGISAEKLRLRRRRDYQGTEEQEEDSLSQMNLSVAILGAGQRATGRERSSKSHSWRTTLARLLPASTRFAA